LEQRRAQRYNLELPLQILQLGDRLVNRSEQTRDISSGGVCFLSGDNVDIGGKIEYVITLSGNTPPVRIRCLGKVLRSSRPDTGGPYEVAVTMERYQFVRTDERERERERLAATASA
jgi:PilZ domain